MKATATKVSIVQQQPGGVAIDRYRVTFTGVPAKTVGWMLATLAVAAEKVGTADPEANELGQALSHVARFLPRAIDESMAAAQQVWPVPESTE